jgi:hypothetical protein
MYEGWRRKIWPFFGWTEFLRSTGSRLLEAGWPVHYVQHMLGHASLQQTSTYLNATLRGLHESMRSFDQSRPACKPLANKPARGFRPVRKQAPARNGKSFCH